MKPRRLVAVLACRNSGSSLYGKPLQRLDINSGWRVLDQVIANIRKFDFVEDIILAIAEGVDNLAYKKYAEMANLRYVIGDEEDVLRRLIQGLEFSGGTDLIRVTTESPFLYWQAVEDAWKNHIDSQFDATFMDEIIDGCGFEIITKEALQKSWNGGDKRHRSELCTLFIRENRKVFLINQLNAPAKLVRKDLRFTIDYPEDLIVCRGIFAHSKENCLKCNYDLMSFVDFMDLSPHLTRLIYPYTEEGYRTMYL